MKYAIVGAAFSGNKGAASMLESSIQNLSEIDEHAQFNVLSVYPTSDISENSYPHVKVLDASPVKLGVLINGGALVHRLLPPLRGIVERVIPEVASIANADVLIDEGGITFVDGRGKFLIYNIATVLPGIFTGTPVYKAAQAMGPFHTQANKLSAKFVLPHIKRIVARGDVTFNHLSKLGLSNVVSGVDVAFGLKVTEAAKLHAAETVNMSYFDGGRVIGFSPSQVLAKSLALAGRDYAAETAAIIDHITGELDRNAVLVAHSARSGSMKTHNNDLPICREIYSKLKNPDRVLFLDQELPAQDLRYIISKCDVLVASRFHGMISALATGVPPLVIGWSHKYGEVLDRFEIGQYVLKAEDATLAKTQTLLTTILENRDQIADLIESHLPEIDDEVRAQFSDICAVASGSVKP